MIYQVKCAVCGEKFQTEQYNRKYCSPECKKIGQKPLIQKHQREYNQREKERRKQQQSEFIGKCKICGNPVKRDSGRLKYCSDECVKIAKNLAAEKHRIKKHNGREYSSEVHRRALTKTLADIRKKSTLDKDIQTLKQDGEKLGLKSYDYGKYAHAKGL